MNATTKTILGMCSALVLLAAIGCSHTHRFNPNPKIGTLQEHKLSGHTLAVDLSGVPETYKDRASGHKYQMTGIRANVHSVVRKLFAKERWVEDPARADYLLKLKLDLRIGAALMGTRCETKAQAEIVRRDQVVSTGTGSDAVSIPTTGAGGANCEIASLKAMSRALDDALGRM